VSGTAAVAVVAWADATAGSTKMHKDPATSRRVVLKPRRRRSIRWFPRRDSSDHSTKVGEETGEAIFDTAFITV